MDSQEPLLAARELVVGYRKKSLLAPIDWAVRPRERWALVGANGSGKTTLLHTLVGLHPAVSGHVIRRSDARVSFISQRAGLRAQVPLTVEAFVAGGLICGLRSFRALRLAQRRRNREAVREMLELVKLTEVADRQVDVLSEGMRQRAWLGRALVGRPHLVVLDEPTSAMDAPSEATMLRLLVALCDARGASSLVVGHHLHAMLAAATHVALLAGGPKPLAIGPRAALEDRVEATLGASALWTQTAPVAER